MLTKQDFYKNDTIFTCWCGEKGKYLCRHKAYSDGSAVIAFGCGHHYIIGNKMEHHATSMDYNKLPDLFVHLDKRTDLAFLLFKKQFKDITCKDFK